MSDTLSSTGASTSPVPGVIHAPLAGPIPRSVEIIDRARPLAGSASPGGIVPLSVSIFDRARPLAGSAPDPDDASWPALSGDGEGGPDFPGSVPPAPPPDVGAADPEAIAICAALEQNDTGNGRRLLNHFGREILNVREVGWHTYDGRVWVREGGDEAVMQYAQRTAERIHAEADVLALYPHEEVHNLAADPLRKRDYTELTPAERVVVDEADRVRKQLGRRRADRRKFATSSGNDSRLTCMIRQAAPYKTVGPKKLDADHMLFNCTSGTLQLRMIEDPDRAGEARAASLLEVVQQPHNRDDLVTKCAPVTYDPAAECPKWSAFMERFQPDPTIRRFLQAFHGLALTGMNGHQSFIYSHGKGANGKSTFMEALGELFGPYSDTLNAESLSGAGQRRGDQATPDFADLPGVRYLRVAELPRGEPLRESLIKALTGGDKLKVRHLNKGFFDLMPVFKAGMSGNDLPQIGGLDDGIWRRVKLVPWSVKISDEERRPMADILAEFREERSGILNWLLDGLRIYVSEGLVTPKKVEEATRDYREDMDPIGAFTADCLESAPGHFETAKDIYEAFQSWCVANSVRAWTQTTFGRTMVQKGFEREKTRVRRYLNVRLHDVPQVASPAAPREGERD